MRKVGLPRRLWGVFRSRTLRFLPLLRPLVWLALLLSVAVGLWAVLSVRRDRVRLMPHGFPAPVDGANVPTLGVNVALDRYDDQALPSVLDRVADAGFVWVRQPFIWSQIRQEGSADGFDWTGTDRIIDALRDFPQLQLVAVLEDDPPHPPEDPDNFAAFASAFAERYGDQIAYYQIWDEPNLAAHWGGGSVSPFAYADLLARTAQALRAADADARILLAGLAPTTEDGPQNLSEIRFLDALYQAGAAPYFDVVAAKPYGFDTGPDDRRVDPAVLNVSRLLLLREVMVEHGDAGKAIWASHWGWNALPRTWDGPPSIWGQTDEATQAAWSVAMLERARDEWPWMGAMIIETLQPSELPSATSGGGLEDPRWGFSLLAPDGTPRPVFDALADWAHALPAAAPVGGYPVRNRWATYDGSWRVGPLAADVEPPAALQSDLPGHADSGVPVDPLSAAESQGPRAHFRFDGTRVALTVRRGPYRGFLHVTVDGEPANALPRDELGRAYVVLYDQSSGLTTVPLATGLAPGPHTVEVVAAGGQGEWPLVDWRVGATPTRSSTVRWMIGLAAAAFVLAVLLVHDLRRVDWPSSAVAVLELPCRWQAGLTAGCAGVLWAAAALSWGRPMHPTIPSAACLVVSLLTLPVLTFLFTLRLDLGLSSVALAAPFYLVPDRMFYRALSLPEVLVVLCLLAYAARRIAHIPERAWDGAAEPMGAGALLGWSGTGCTSVDAAVAVLALAALLAGAAAADRLAALFELRSVFLLPILYYTLLRLTPLSCHERRRIWDAFLLGGVGVALVGLGQAALGRSLVAAEGGLMRLQSVYHSPNSLGLYLGRVWPFLAAGAGWDRTGRRRTLSLLALLLVTAALGLSLSRGALLLALPASILAIGWRAGGRRRQLAVALVVVGGLVLLPLLRFPRFAGLLDLGQGTTFFRLQLWRSSLRMIRDHPLLGVGPGNFLGVYRTRYVLPSAWEEFNLEHAHNLLLDLWTRLGLLGLVAGLAVQAAFWSAIRRWPGRRALTLGLTGSMAAVLAHGFVDNAVFSPDLALTFFMMLAMADGGEWAEYGGRSQS